MSHLLFQIYCIYRIKSVAPSYIWTSFRQTRIKSKVVIGEIFFFGPLRSIYLWKLGLVTSDFNQKYIQNTYKNTNVNSRSKYPANDMSIMYSLRIQCTTFYK